MFLYIILSVMAFGVIDVFLTDFIGLKQRSKDLVIIAIVICVIIYFIVYPIYKVFIKPPLIKGIENTIVYLSKDPRSYSYNDYGQSKKISDEYEDEEDYSQRKKVEYYEDDTFYGEYNNSSESGYHYTSDYTREDGTEVSGYIAGNPDDSIENNIEYMEDHGDSEGVEIAYDSLIEEK